SGVRRIEALTGAVALEYINDQIKLMKEVQGLLKSPRDIVRSVEGLVNEKNNLKKELEGLHDRQALTVKEGLLQQVEQVKGANLVISKVDVPSAEILK